MTAERIVCLSAETTETLYLLGQQHRIVGISGFSDRPPQARREKPRISAFTTAHIDRILALRPDLVLGFSELQADLLHQIAQHGVAVHLFDQRSIAQILESIVELGALVGCEEAAGSLARQLATHVQTVRNANANVRAQPRVYFEEWNQPRITAIGWVSELIEIAGGTNVFADLSRLPLASQRIIHADAAIIERAPDIIIGSWCGKRFQRAELVSRPGWDRIPAVMRGEVHEIRSSLLLQPGPGALTDGLQTLTALFDGWRARHSTRSECVPLIVPTPALGPIVGDLQA